MHYRNGREAKPGDKVIHLSTGMSGIIYSLNPDVGTCNARIAEMRPYDSYVTVGDLVHAEDVDAAFPKKSD